MFGVRFISLAVTAFLLGIANAAPAPYDPGYGEVVHIAPVDTTGASLGTGGTIPHPHINLGPVDGQGTYELAPVTHGTGSHLRPYMPAPNEHGLRGVTRLDHITGHSSSISRSRGRLAGATVSQALLNDIHEAKALVEDHRIAGYHHSLAGQAHRAEQAYHDAQSAHHFQHGNAQAGAYHARQASIHDGHATKHEQASLNHYAAANAVTGPDPMARIHAQNSAAYAQRVHQHLNEAVQHDADAHYHATHHDHIAAQESRNHAAASRHAANRASATSITHHNRATGQHL